MLWGGEVYGEKIRLVTGEVLEGKVTARMDGLVFFSHPVLGKLIIPAGKIVPHSNGLEKTSSKAVLKSKKAKSVKKSVNLKAGVKNAPRPTGVAVKPAPKPSGVSGKRSADGYWDKRKNRFEVGFNGSSGRRDTLNLYLSVNSDKVTKEYRSKIDSAYFLNTTSGATTKHEFMAGVLHDWLLPESAWFYFGQGRLDVDEFEDYDVRLSGNIGFGNQLMKTKDVALTIRGGVGGAQELGSDDEEFRPEALFGGELSWKMTAFQKLTGQFRFYPDLSSMFEYRVTSSAAWQIKLNTMEGATFKLGVRNEYKSHTEGSAVQNDFKFFGALVFEF